MSQIEKTSQMALHGNNSIYSFEHRDKTKNSIGRKTLVMKKIRVLVIINLIIILFTNSIFANDYSTVQDGDLMLPSTWSGGVVPVSFEGTGKKEATITINNHVYYNNDFSVPQNCTFTVNPGAVFITHSFTIIGNNKTLIVNGTVICNGTIKISTSSFSGDGTVIAANIDGDVPSEMAGISGANFWNGAVSNDWTNTQNWSAGTVPSSTDWASIDISPANWPVISTSELIRGITIGPDQQLTITSGGSLQMDTIYVYGNLFIQSDASGTGNVYADNANGNGGNVEVQRYMDDNKWHIISSPVRESIADFVTDNSALIRDNGTYQAFGPYDEMLDDWSLYFLGPQSDNFVKGKGYILSTLTGSTITFKGENINTGPFTVNVQASNYGWNAIGNPYPSSLQVTGTNSFLETNAASLAPGYEGLYVWDPSVGGTGDYVVIADAGYSFAPNGESQLDQDKIAVGQGFMVKVAAVETLNFNSFMQRLNSATSFKSTEVQSPALRLTIQSGNLTNSTIVGFKKNMTVGLDSGNDLGKLKGNPDIALYTQLIDRTSDIDFAIQSLPYQSFELRNIPVGLDLKDGGEATFTLETVNFPEGAQVYLEDRESHTHTQLNLKNAAYSVTLPSMSGYGRFNLIVTNFTANNITTSSSTRHFNQPEFNVFTHDKIIFVNGPADKDTHFALYGIDGKLWYQNRAEVSNQNRIDATTFPAGIYLVRIDRHGKPQTCKVIVSNR